MNKGKRDHKQADSSFKTFKVPFDLGELKENIINTTNSYPKLLKEQLINQAFKSHSQGNIREAAKSYQAFIEQGFKDHRVFSNYGVILKDIGNSEEAESSIRKAIELKPNYAKAHFNLGALLKEMGKLEESKASFFKAIELKPNMAEAHFNLGNVLRDLGLLKEAEISMRKAIKINPDFASAHNNLGNILCTLGKSEEAEIYLRKAIKIKPDCVKAHIKLGEILFDTGKIKEGCISQWNAIKLNPSFEILETYRKKAKVIHKAAFYITSYSIFNHFSSIIEINPNLFEILVRDDFDKNSIRKIRNDLNNKDIIIRSQGELIKRKLIYEKLISIHADEVREYLNNKNNIQSAISMPVIKLFGKKNIRLMYTAGKNKYTIYSYWNKYYDGILCFGTYHQKRFKLMHNIATAQMGYPRFDKYFEPGFKRDDLLQKFRCDPKKKTIVWLPTWNNLASIEKYIKAIASLKIDHNIVVRPHPSMKINDQENYKKLFNINFNYIDDNEDDNVQLYALADLMFFDYGGPMFGSLYLNKNFAFLDMKIESKDNKFLGDSTSEDYLKSFFPDRIAKLDNLKYICNYCLNNPPSNSIIKTLREEFFNTSYQGESSKRAYNLLISNDWVN